MREAEKIEEAEFFYAHLVNVEKSRSANPDTFKFFLSAFLSAARSVLQYAHGEAVGKPGGQGWYEGAVSSVVLQYFKDKRDDNIHVEPVTVQKEIDIEIEESVKKWMDNIFMDMADPPPPSLQPRSPFTSVTVTDKYRFKDWVGTESVLPLCAKYLQELGTFVSDGQAKGFLTR